MSTEAYREEKHYGGSDYPFETIKVMRAKLTPQEFAGFLKGNAQKYLDRHVAKDGQRDLDKALDYMRRFHDFVRSEGHDVVYPPVMFWSDDGELPFCEEAGPIADRDEIAGLMPSMRVAVVHTSIEPYRLFVIRIPQEDDSDVHEWFTDRHKADDYLRDLVAEEGHFATQSAERAAQSTAQPDLSGWTGKKEASSDGRGEATAGGDGQGEGGAQERGPGGAEAGPVGGNVQPADQGADPSRPAD